MVAGLEDPSGGSIQLQGSDITHLRPSARDVGFVFQFYALYPHLSVRENIGFPLAAIGMPRAQRQAASAEIAGRLGISHLLGRHPRQLSGGDQQRVALGRAMVRRPRVWLMDEPLGTLDADQRLAMREFIREQQLASNVTTVYVTHDQEEAMSLADRVVVMEGGRIAQVGTPHQVYEHPANRFVAEFVGSPGMNFICGEARGGRLLVDGQAQLDWQLPASSLEGPVVVGVRPEHLRLGLNGVPAQVVMQEYLGSARIAHLDCGFAQLRVRLGAEERLRIGENVRIAADAEFLNLFSASDGRRL